MVVDVEKMSDAELRAELNVRGANVGPVTGTTRSLYEKKLKNMLAAKGKTPARPAASAPAPTPKAAAPAPPSTPKSKPAPKPAVVPKSPARKADKTPDTSRRSLPRAAANTTVNSTFNRSEIEEMSDSDDNREEDEEDEILSPKSRQSSFRSTHNSTTSSVGRGRPVSSTPTKKLSPVHKPTPTAPASSSRVSSTRTTINTTTRVPTTPRSIHVPVPGLITDFTPSFATFGSDRPGATPPRKSIYTSSVSNVLNDLGNTTGEEDDDEFEGQESSRIIYKNKEPSKGMVKNAWNKVLGYGFNVSKTPGESYDLRTGSTRVRVQKNPKTGKVTVDKLNIFNDALFNALNVIFILFVVLSISYVLITYQPKTSDIYGYWGVAKAAFRDSANFVYNYAVRPIVYLVVLVFVTMTLWYSYKVYQSQKEREEVEFFDLVDRVTNHIRETAADGDPYVSQPHVRDLMFPPSKRRAPEMARWEKAVKYIDTNESRVATEIIILPSGNECAVWKWIGTQSHRRW
ncbi:CBN-LEM-2 protein [Caenorhabditis brenneri]|uniref:CBN-LEM-2 protein n=1 Tax=Caenorhabditis brenneri TaxID=135651 RepID=G0MZ48_CAEBE|nr:CBN-LEM-2 protein [Caenorhabditis brenneri]